MPKKPIDLSWRLPLSHMITILKERRERAMQTKPNPPLLFDIGRLSLEGLTLMYLFSVSFVGEPEAELVAIARKELERRGALKIVSDTQDLWDLDEETREELAEVFTAHHLLESFNEITAPEAS